MIHKSSHRKCSKKILKDLRNSQENTCVGVLFLIKLEAYNFFKKKTAALVFSSEIYKIFKNEFV